MKLFVELLGKFLFGLFVVFIVLVYLAVLITSVYIMLMPWIVLDTDLSMKIFAVVMGLLMFMITLTCIYFSLEAWVNPTSSFYKLPRKSNSEPNEKESDKNRYRGRLGTTTLHKTRNTDNL